MDEVETAKRNMDNIQEAYDNSAWEMGRFYFAQLEVARKAYHEAIINKTAKTTKY